MKKFLCAAAAAAALEAATMHQLFEGLKNQPITRIVEYTAKLAALDVQSKKDRFYPSIDAFASIEHYNAPTNLRPMSPLESTRLTLSGEPLPFARTIERLGVKVAMPLFVKSLFGLEKKAAMLARSAEAKKRLTILRNEALVLGLDAQLAYIESLRQAIDARIASIKKRYEDMTISVESGRAPAIALDKLDEAMIALQTTNNDLAIKMATIQARIESLTGLAIERAAPIRKAQPLREGTMLPLLPLQAASKAKAHAVEAAKGRLYPSVGLEAVWSENHGQSAVAIPTPAHPVVDGDDVHRGYGHLMLGVTMPIFAKGRYTAVEMAEVNLAKTNAQLAQAKADLEADVKSLRKSLALLERSEMLSQKSLRHRRDLLKYAKVAVQTGRMDEEEYLRYEEGLLSAQSALYKTRADRWQTLAKLAVIYGNDLDGIVK